jgi:putative addiction module component (TIGR02574 family)
MMPTIQDLGIDQLSPEERLRLIGDIWDSFSLYETPIPESHKEELDRRLAAADSTPNAELTWEELRARLRVKK